jgi:hypothetical protein
MKKPIVIILLVLCILVLIAVIFIAISKGNQSTINPVGLQEAKATPTVVPNLKWDDPTGFTFLYPEFLSLNKHDEDKSNYAHVELSDKESGGSIVVWAKDLPIDKKGKTLNTIADWLKFDPKFLNASSIDTTLGGQNAKKISMPATKIQLTATIYDDLLFYIEGSSMSAEMAKNYDNIAGSFEFKPLPTAASSENQDNSNEQQSVDEEEVVE